MMSAFGNSPEKHMPNKLPCLTRVPPAMPPLPPPIANWIRVGQGLPSRVRIPQDCVHVGGKHGCGKECTFTIRLGSARLTGPRQSCLAMPRARSHARIKSRGLSSRLVSRRPRTRRPKDGLHVRPRDGLHVVEYLTNVVSALLEQGRIDLSFR